MENNELHKEFLSLVSGKTKTNIFSTTIKKKVELWSELKEKSSSLDNLYENPQALQRMWFLFKENIIPYCKCGKPRSWRNFKIGYNKTCGSKECVSGVTIDSCKEYNMKTYGVNHLFETEQFKNKFKKDSLEKYGFENPASNEKVKEKIKLTNLERFGETSWLRVDANKEKIKKSLIQNASLERERKIKDFNIPINVLEYKSNTHIRILCNICNTESKESISFFNKRLSIKKSPCLICEPILYSESKGEIEVFDFIRSIYDGEIIRNLRINGNGKEIDLLIKNLNLGFEFNGIYWHSEIFKAKDYHIEKKKEIERDGIKVFNIWEDDWEYKKDIVKSRILNSLGLSKKIFARKCTIKEIDSRLERIFLNENHIQGYVPSKIKIGLFYKDEIVSLMTFGEKRVSLGNKKGLAEYELLRFCNKINTTVIGGASKIFKVFMENFSPSNIISYQDNSWGTGNLYKTLGFDLLENIRPNYYWCKKNIRYHRYNFRKDLLVKRGYDKNKTENQIMTEEGYYKLWDFGNLKWEYTKKA